MHRSHACPESIEYWLSIAYLLSSAFATARSPSGNSFIVDFLDITQQLERGRRWKKRKCSGTGDGTKGGAIASSLGRYWDLYITQTVANSGVFAPMYHILLSRHTPQHNTPTQRPRQAQAARPVTYVHICVDQVDDLNEANMNGLIVTTRRV